MIHQEVHRQQLARRRDTACGEHLSHACIRFDQSIAQLNRPRLQEPGPAQHHRRIPHRRPRPRIRAVGERENSHAIIRQEQHKRSITGITAAVAQGGPQIAIHNDNHAHPISRSLRACRRAAFPRALRHARKVQALREFAHARALHRARIRATTRRPCVEQPRHIFRIIIRAGLQAAHRAERAVRHRRLEFPRVVLPAVTESPALGWRFFDFVPRRGHAQRAKQRALHIVLVGLLRNVGHDAPEHRVTHVRILHRDARRPRKGHAFAQHPREVGFWQRRLTIAPRIVGHQSAGVRKQIAHANSRRIFGRITPVANLRNVRFRRGVERKFSFVAQLQDGKRGEGLGHRGDAKERLRGHRPLGLHILHAKAFHVLEPSIHHNSVH